MEHRVLWTGSHSASLEITSRVKKPQQQNIKAFLQAALITTGSDVRNYRAHSREVATLWESQNSL